MHITTPKEFGVSQYASARVVLQCSYFNSSAFLMRNFKTKDFGKAGNSFSNCRFCNKKKYNAAGANPNGYCQTPAPILWTNPPKSR